MVVCFEIKYLSTFDRCCIVADFVIVPVVAVTVEGTEVEEDTDRVADDGNWDGQVPLGPLLGGQLDPMLEEDDDGAPVALPFLTCSR